MRKLRILNGLLLSVMLLLCYLGKPASQAQAQQQNPRFFCEALPTQECAFVVFDTHGSSAFVVAGRQTHEMNTNTIGMKYCNNWGDPRVPMPKWPGCYGAPKAGHNVWGIVRGGNNQ